MTPLGRQLEAACQPDEGTVITVKESIPRTLTQGTTLSPLSPAALQLCTALASPASSLWVLLFHQV